MLSFSFSCYAHLRLLCFITLRWTTPSGLVNCVFSNQNPGQENTMVLLISFVLASKCIICPSLNSIKHLYIWPLFYSRMQSEKKLTVHSLALYLTAARYYPAARLRPHGIFWNFMEHLQFGLSCL